MDICPKLAVVEPHGRDGPIFTVVLADDDADFRACLQAHLANERTVGAVCEAEDGEKALALVETHEPDLLLVDLGMPGLNGIETTRRALSRRPSLKIMVVSLHKDRFLVAAALDAGATGYVLKDRVGEDLTDGLATVMRGGTYLSATLDGY